MRWPSLVLLCLVTSAMSLAGVSCAEGRGEHPVISTPVRCPDGTARVERRFRSAETASKVVGINESCERPDGLLHGPTADWHMIDESGSSELRRVYQGQYRDGQEVGVWHQWHANGEKKSDRYYLLDGELVAHIFWYPSSRLRAAYQYWRHKRHGVEIYWEESGELSSVRLFHRGRLVYTSEPVQPNDSKAHLHASP